MVRKVNGPAIKAIRQAADMSQTELASRSGVTASMLSKVERGANGMSPATARRVAEALGVDIRAITNHAAEAVA